MHALAQLVVEAPVVLEGVSASLFVSGTLQGPEPLWMIR